MAPFVTRSLPVARPMKRASLQNLKQPKAELVQAAILMHPERVAGFTLAVKRTERCSNPDDM
jgi:hypothetical protein